MGRRGYCQKSPSGSTALCHPRYRDAVTYCIPPLIALSLVFLVGCPAEEFPVADPVDSVEDTAALDTGLPGLPEFPDYNVAPWVQVTSPSPGMTIAVGESVKLVGQVSDDRDLASDLVCTWISNLDGPLGQTVPLDAGLAQLVVEGLSVGQHSLTLEAIDSEGLRGSAQGVLQVNGPPSAPTVEIVPPSPTSQDDLVAVILEELTDPNRPATSLVVEWRWTRDGSLMSNLVGDTVSADKTLLGEVWKVRVRAFDGHVFSPGAEATATVISGAGDPP